MNQTQQEITKKYLDDQIKQDGQECSMHVEITTAYKVLLGNPEG
jgi:hypothetical protein